jgi:uncharacterized HAD superfamily protein
MAVGFDLDGVLTLVPIRINFKPPWWFGLLLSFMPPNKKMLEILNKCKANNDKIILVSARPKQLGWVTRRWLKRHDVSYDKIFLIDPGKRKEERKLEIIRKEGIDKFFDDDKAIVNYLKEQKINACFPVRVA